MVCCAPCWRRATVSRKSVKSRDCGGRRRRGPFAASCRQGGSAYTLIELLIVISLISILAGIVLPRFEPGIHEQLQSAAQIVAADLAMARDLAVANGSSYGIRFDDTENRYVMEHTGSNPLLDTLPRSPFSASTTATTERTTDLDDLPFMGPTVSLARAERAGGSWQATNRLEFGPLGELTAPGDVRIWLVCGAADQRRYISVSVHAVTGLPSIGAYEAQGPASGGAS